MAITIQTTTYNVIYVISRDQQPGLLKIGKTSVATDDVEKLTPNCAEMIEATKLRYSDAATMGVTDMHILYTEVAYFENEEGTGLAFDDHAVHDVLIKSGYKRSPIETEMGTGEEWFEVDLDHAVKAIAAVKNEQSRIDGPKDKPLEHVEIKFRDEQTAAIEQTLAHFNDEGGEKMLWNAKMRFGKTLCALEVVRRMNLPRVMILTHRPTVRSGWFDDYHLRPFENTLYGSKNGKPGNLLNDKENDPEGYVKGKDLQTMEEELAAHDTHYIYFASMQDLRGKQKDEHGNKIWKGNNALVYNTPWDLIILDEAHEGTQTALGKEVIADLCKDHKPLLLYLSGTPYNILSLFKEEEIYTWDYTMEQEAKNSWDDLHPNEKNPYEGLAQLHIYTYDIGDVYKNNDYRKEDDKDDYFNFAEFFRTWLGEENKDGCPMPPEAEVGHFVHEDDVKKFLDLLCSESPTSYYPFSNQDFRAALKHTLWMLPGVAEARRMAELIYAHKLHTEYGFEVVNVAGEGDSIDAAKDDFKKIEKQERDALLRVKTAVSNHDKTITLSCGRLTTGVSVPEWTGVLMLRGSYNTGAANYMQTIFRSQTPYKNGAIKANCYAFDFAPDRTLTVVDEFVKIQPRSRGTSTAPGNGTDDPERIESTLRHLPVIAMKGGREVEYDSMRFMEEVNRAYTDHVIRNGFKSRHLFRDVATFTAHDHELLAKIGVLIGGAKVPLNKDGTITMSDGGLTGEGGEKNKKKKKAQTDTPPSQKPKKKNEEKEKIRHSKDVLDLIFVRIPLLLFGAVEDAESLNGKGLLSDDFIDEESWAEFMPRNFKKVNFGEIVHLLKLDVLIASTAKIIEQAREADALPIEERTRRMADIVAKFRFPDKETVLTPWRVVNMHMTDTLGGYDFYNDAHTTTVSSPRFVDRGSVTAEVLRPHDTRILEINSKSGVYPLWVAYNLWRMQRTDGMTAADERRLWGDVLRRNLYVVCKTRMAEKITRRVLAGYDADIHINAVTFDRLIERLKDEKKCNKLVKKILSPLTYNNQTEEMKELQFNAVVGNPPYQLEGISTRKSPIYHLFYNLAFELSDKVSLITPARFLYSAGQTPKDWNEKMLNDSHLKVVDYFQDTTVAFPFVDIKGGVVITYRDSKKEFGKIGHFSAFPELESILAKVKNKFTDGFCDLISSRGMYKFTEQAFLDYPKAKAVQGEGSGLQITSSSFDNMPMLFKKEKEQENMIQIYGREGNTRVYRWICQKYVQSNDYFNEYNVFVPEANGSGAIGEVLSTPIIGSPIIGHTDTFLSIGKFATEAEAEACLKYIKTKFARTMLGTLKATQHNPRDTWANVPLQDFTANSDIDWSQSIEEIDQYLYKKYNLSQEDIDFIEKTIKPM